MEKPVTVRIAEAIAIKNEIALNEIDVHESPRDELREFSLTRRIQKPDEFKKFTIMYERKRLSRPVYCILYIVYFYF